MANDASTTKTGKTEKTAKGWHECKCLTGTGRTCGGQTQGSFARGHDARIASRLAESVANGDLEIEKAVKDLRTAGGGDLLEGKMRRSAKLRQEKKEGAKAAKAEKPAKEKGAKNPTTVEVPEGTTAKVNDKVKVTHGSRSYDAVVVRDAGEKLVARHRLIGKNCDHGV